MEFTSLVTPEAVFAGLQVSSKKQVLQALAREAAAATGIRERLIFDTLLERERLGTTAMGNGVAIPHGKIGDLPGLRGFFARLSKPVEFDAPDNEKVDLIFLLLASESAGADHLKALARVSRLLREETTRGELRAAGDRDSIYAALVSSAADRAA